jgi:hypothetical protein
MNQSTLNPLGQPIGLALDGWTAPPHPSRSSLAGRLLDATVALSRSTRRFASW